MTMSHVLAFQAHPPLPPLSALPTLQVDVQKKVFDERLFISAPPEIIWTFLTHPEALPLWHEDLEDVCLDQWQSDAEADVVGAVRILYLSSPEGAYHTQVITDWEPGQTLGYTTLEGFRFTGFEADLHVSLFKLYPCADGTEVQWLNYVEFPEEIGSPVGLYRLGKYFHQTLIYLKWQVEKAHALALDF